MQSFAVLCSYLVVSYKNLFLFPEKLNEVIVPEFTGDSYMLIPLHSNMAKQMSIEVWFLSQTHSGKSC